MSSIYNLEPQPTASAIIHTTLGEIHVELFAKQTPLTCRNFLQHCLDGYYDGTVFHRLVPNFILQGGDPTGTGHGGEAIYDGGALGGDLDAWPMDQRYGKNAGPNGVNFKDEFHSRLKINRRGILAMANEGRPDTNGSQFFFTLDKAEELNGKNTMFGRVAGDTIYNLAKIGESEWDETTERPLYPVKIQRVEILVNPFEDMRKRSRVAPVMEKPKVDKDKKAKRRKGGKQLLSFGDEEGEEEAPVLKKAKFDTRIVMEEEEEDTEAAPPREKPSRPKKTKHDVPTRSTKEPEAPKDDATEKAVDKETPGRRRDEASRKHKVPSPSPEPSPNPEPVRKKTALERANEELAALKASMRRTVHEDRPVEEKKQKSALEAMIPETSMRGRKRRPGGNHTSASEDQAALSVLKAFQARLDKAPPGKGKAVDESAHDENDDENDDEESGGKSKRTQEDEAELCDLHFIANCQSCTAWDKQDKEESDDEGWMSHSLSFAADRLGKDLSNRRKAEEELVVIDPREKARTLKDEKRAEREARAGGSGRAWDQARNAQMAKAASVAGRGAR